MTDDAGLSRRINDLAAEEEQIFSRAGSGGGMEPAEQERLRQIQLELDQAYDLLRQRQGRRDAGESADLARPRPPEVVENYEQ